MSLYNRVQKKLTEYKETEQRYWDDLKERLTLFKPKLIDYLGVEGMELCDVHDKNKYPIVLVGNKVREEVEDELVRNFEKVDGQKPSLRFFVQINLSKYNSEIYVKSEIFECLFWGKDDSYTMDICGESVGCRKVTDKTDFTNAFDFIVKKIEESVDTERFL
ncbi:MULTISPECIES: hypothetical protein [unclassified Enterobacter cloacae complex]|uniref:hypothetical protein n=1 Tax=unclassified Enterobacter cloacae complex TaxID=2757714 RepID=UPI0018726C4B|nr:MULTISPECIES: hypothetical protein [unclassified Enterobacter cloacae complex]MBE4887410.1 hypothetical protein [Enterobacter cloacae complex sp. P37RS]MBE7432020.1 hypothetical protein [Enterobacter cloacae complex sp. P36RS]